MNPQDRTRAILMSAAPPTWKILLVAIADHMGPNDDGARPGVARLVQLSGVCERQARGALRAMEKSSILRREYRGPNSPPWTLIEWDTLAVFAGVAKTARGGGNRQGGVAVTAREGSKDRQGGVAKTAPDPTIDPTSEATTEPPTEACRPSGSTPRPWIPTDEEIALWGQVMAARGKGELQLGAPRKPKQTAPGWTRLKRLREILTTHQPADVLLVAEWAARCPSGRAKGNRENETDGPDTWLRESHWEPYLGFARAWEAADKPMTLDDARKAVAPPDPMSLEYPWCEGMKETLRPSHADRPVMIRAKMLDRKDWYEAHNVTPLHAAVGA